MSEIVTFDESVGVLEIHDDTGAILDVVETPTEIVQIISSEMVGPQGPPGVQGPVGVQGAQGDPGPFSPTFRQEFATPSVLWALNHNLGVYPVVNLYGFDGFAIGGDIQMPDRNTVLVLFDVPIAGIAILKA